MKHRISSLTRFEGRLGSRRIHFCRDCGCTHEFLDKTECRPGGFGHNWVVDGLMILDDPIKIDGIEDYSLVECVTCTICKASCIKNTTSKDVLVFYVFNELPVDYPSFKCSSIRMARACT